MTVAVEAIYENGVLRPEKPLGFKEHSKVRVIIEGESEAAVEDDDPTGWKAARRFIGLWKDAPAGEPIAAEHDQHLYK
jgi:predicted DNA-binding antitoxin AbrB/MazE fold protein